MAVVDVSRVVRATLVAFGVSQERLDAFDQHSSIELAFKNISPIYITVKNDQVWVWSELRVLNVHNIGIYASTLIELLQSALPGVATGQAVLGKGEGCYEVKALLDYECIVSEAKMAQMLRGFYELVSVVHVKLQG